MGCPWMSEKERARIRGREREREREALPRESKIHSHPGSPFKASQSMALLILYSQTSPPHEKVLMSLKRCPCPEQSLERLPEAAPGEQGDPQQAASSFSDWFPTQSVPEMNHKIAEDSATALGTSCKMCSWNFPFYSNSTSIGLSRILHNITPQIKTPKGFTRFASQWLWSPSRDAYPLRGLHGFMTEDKCSLEGEPVSCTGDGNALSARDPLYKDGELSLLPAQKLLLQPPIHRELLQG
uniref:uncharacterized protein LOC125404051 n=1 Tax=Myodes glareolus TaxID=447135 RepID=UPI0020203AEA|nr:uncharacterized protein LOC125404051 [Myodes glareolus]